MRLVLVRRQTTVELRYVPVSIAHNDGGAEVLSLVAVLVIYRGRLLPELMDPGLPKDASVYPLTTPERKLSARFCQLPTTTEARFTFGIEWCHTTAVPEDGGTTSNETSPLRILFRATSASEYARWKQVFGAAIVMPLTRIPAARASCERRQTLGQLKRVPTALQGIADAPNDVLPSSDGDQKCDARCCPDGSGSAGAPPLGDSKCVRSVSTSSSIAATERQSPSATLSTTGCDESVALHRMDCFTVRDEHLPRFKCSPKYSPRHLTRSRLQLDNAFDDPAQHPASSQREFRKSSSLSHLDADRKCSEVADSKRIECGINLKPEANSAEARYRAASSVQVDVQGIIRYFEFFSGPRVLPSGLEARKLVHPKRRWRSAHSMPPSLSMLSITERDGFSWRMTSQLRQQRCQVIREVNCDIERRIRALTNDSSPQVDEPDGSPGLLPDSTTQSTNAPSSTRSTFEGFCCH